MKVQPTANEKYNKEIILTALACFTITCLFFSYMVFDTMQPEKGIFLECNQYTLDALNQSFCSGSFSVNNDSTMNISSSYSSLKVVIG